MAREGRERLASATKTGFEWGGAAILLRSRNANHRGISIRPLRILLSSLALFFGTTSAHAQEVVEEPAEASESGLVEESAPLEISPPLIDEVTRGSGSAIRWEPTWGRFSVGEMVTTGVAAGIAVIAAVLGPDESNPRRGPVLFDQGARDLLRLSSRESQFVARDISDVILATLASYPYMVDSAIVAAWYRGSPDAATQMALINLETMAIAVALEQLTNVIARRERPYGSECGLTIDARSQDCEGSRRYVSFFSGHATMAFTSAGLICSHHINLPLYGGNEADAATCAAALVLAATTGTLRVVGDQHYASDVIMGAFVGTAVGFGVPWLLHYRHGRELGPGESDDPWVRVVPMGLGIGAVGRF